MAKWIYTPRPKNEPILFQPLQDAFWKARRLRLCPRCKGQFDSPPHAVCPACGVKGIRAYHRLSIIAGRRFGKSFSGSIAAAEEASIPGTIGWACAPTNPKLHRYVIPALQQVIPSEWVADYSSEFNDLRLKNGSLIHFQTLEHPDQGRGQGLDWVWMDEACELTEPHWDVLRPSLTERRGGAFFTTSPRSFDWVYERLYKPAEDGVPGYWGARAKTSDNPTISSDEIAEARSTMSDLMFRQEFEADFITFEGAVYGDLIAPQILHTDDAVKAFIPEWPNIDASRQATIGIDTGADHPFGGVKLISTERGLLVVGEYLERDKTFIEHTQNLKRLAGPHSVRWAINKNETPPII